MVLVFGLGFCLLLTCVCTVALWRTWQAHKLLSVELKHVRGVLFTTEQLLLKRGLLADQTAHEIKNPLSAIVCSAEALELMAGHLLPPEQRRCLGLIREFSDHVLRIVGDFLDLSRVEGGRMVPDPSDVNVREMLNNLLDLIRPSAHRRGIRLEVLCEDGPLFAHLDSRHLKQVLFNLIQNSLRYTPKGGEVIIQVARHEDELLAIQVRDDGIGIDPAFLPNIFEPYVTSEGTPSPLNERGMGIGLSVCRSLMELNNGLIMAESAPGKGSTFSLMVPRARPLLLNTRKTVSSDIGVRSLAEKKLVVEGRRLMLCDDGDPVGAATFSLLKAWGACVERVQDATDLVKRLGEAKFDTVLVSPKAMAALTSEVKDQIHAQGGKLLATALDQESGRSALSWGADGVIAAPIDGERLLEALRESSPHPH